jgi:hypothetical protein
VYGKFPERIVAWDMFNVLMSFAWQWEDEKTIHCKALPDFPLYKKDPENPVELVHFLHKLLETPSIIVGHNIRQFDLRRSDAYFIRYGLKKPRNRYVTIDTLVEGKKIGFPGHSLEDLGIYLGVGKKKGHHSGLWQDAFVNHDMKAWHDMKVYNKGDIELTRAVEQKLDKFVHHRPNANVIIDGVCPRCGSEDLIKKGLLYSATFGGLVQGFKCTFCGARPTEEKLR